MGSQGIDSTGGSDPLTVEDWRLAVSGEDHLSRLLSHVESFERNDPAWILIVSQDYIRKQWKQVEILQSRGVPLPLLGVPFAVKDNIDVAGLPTTAACPDFAYTPSENAAVVQSLLDAGAILLGKCNLDAFATGLVGTRSPFGVVPNSFNKDYVSGGSSSGSASVVARGLVPFSLGTDTAGSGRVPAGFNNLVGLKATRGAISTRGVVPACRTLDCVSIFTLTLDDASTVFDVCSVYDAKDAYCRPVITNPPSIAPNPTVAICDNPPWFDGTLHHDAYLDSITKAHKIGWQLYPTDFSKLLRLAALLYEGPWVAERYAAIKDFVEIPGVNIDPTVRLIIQKARDFNASDVFASEYLRKELIRQIEIQFERFDAILVPTTPTFPTLQQVKERPVEENSLLGTYTNFVNFLDWCAVSVPAGFRQDGLPFGLTIISTRWQEQRLFQFAAQFLGTSRQLGATNRYFTDAPAKQTNPIYDHAVVIVGAHLTGFPLNYQLLDVGATLNRTTRTASNYQLFELPYSTKVRKPGLKRVPQGASEGRAIEVEVWNVSNEGLGKLIQLIPPPLGIGSVELEDGSWAKGFVCEPWGFDGARDVTEFGGWRKYISSTKIIPSKKESNSTNVGGIDIKCILIANRGEIAVRIIKTLKKLSIKSVAIYSFEDGKAQHVLDADDAYLLDGTTLDETYLSQDEIIRVAKLSKADAIIPGYGFLSENADFAQTCEDNGLIWIGPTPQQMRQLGLKHLARGLAKESHVPLLPGTEVVDDVESAVVEAGKIKYPVIVKSSAGGGGIGLQQCDTEKALREALETVGHLGKTYFNDSRIFVEKYIKNARHVEVQIIGDGHGKVKHLGDRDCSLQRRMQKVIEESPAVYIPLEVRESMQRAAVKLASSLDYRGVGTVEFIYDLDEKTFYFLEVNTRLQVEHCVTEEVSGLDLVEAMIKVASGNFDFFAAIEVFQPRRVAIEVRIYGESPLQNFRPSSGEIIEVAWPANVRVDTWISPGTVLTPSYDPLLAKLIVSGFDRPEVLRGLAVALENTQISGVETNLAYLRQIIQNELFQSGTFTTTTLNTFKVHLPAFEVLDPGPATTIQDYPGRIGKWSVGIPPSGPMDNYSFQIANKVLGNEPEAAGLECTTTGPTLLFHSNTYVSVVGAPGRLTVDNIESPYGKPILICAGQILQLASFESGSRAYIGIKGGIRVPMVLGSRSTFALGKTGGYCGRILHTGDIIPFKTNAAIPEPQIAPQLPSFTSSWTIRVLPGPHGWPEFMTQAAFSELFQRPWKVHYNTNRVGIRLSGPKPSWARASGGEAGLHPSNIHDSPYSIGSISFTGDEAVILTCDGPSLGGFMIFATVILADLWKLGQMRPGDGIEFVPVTAEDALSAYQVLTHSVDALIELEEDSSTLEIQNPVLLVEGNNNSRVVYRQSGDAALLVEFGEDSFNIRTSFRIYNLVQYHERTPIVGVLELTAGVRAVHVRYQNSLLPLNILLTVQQVISSLDHGSFDKGITSRTFHLPLAFDNSSVAADVARYSQTIRSNAPWLPSNTEFLRQINGLSSIAEVNTCLLSSSFLVVGLGDVFFGSPCAVPLDPRHRLFGMKYNPSRSFTTEGTVGVGGQYLCIYAIDSPGGYQLVGRTVPIWQRFGKDDKQWMFNLFDRIAFYPISEEELNISRAKGTANELVKIEDGIFDLTSYQGWLEDNKEDIEKVRSQRAKALIENDAVIEALKPPPPIQHDKPEAASDKAELGVILKAGVAGKCWKILVEEGDIVEKGQTLASNRYCP